MASLLELMEDLKQGEVQLRIMEPLLLAALMQLVSILALQMLGLRQILLLIPEQLLPVGRGLMVFRLLMEDLLQVSITREPFQLRVLIQMVFRLLVPQRLLTLV